MTSSAAARGPQPADTFDLSDLDRTDRLLLGSSVVAWLIALGAGVAATVALVDLGRGQTGPGGSGTPWFLYVVIALSAVVIVAAVPLLLRARRQGHGQKADSGSGGAGAGGERPQRFEAPTEKFRAPAVGAEPRSGLSRALLPPPGASSSPAVNRAWLRCTAGIATAMGVATVFGFAGTYLMARDDDTVAWVLHGVAVVITLAMAGIPFYFLRELRTPSTD